MEIKAVNNKLMQQLSDNRLRVKAYGLPVARRIGRRIDELKSATTLDEISTFPPARLHRLRGQMNGLFAVDVSSNYRLVFAGYNRRHKQVTDVTVIVAVVFISVVDYH